jgi:integrase
MLSVSKSTVEVTAEGFRFLNRAYTKNGEHRRFKIDHSISVMVQDHIAENGIGPGQLIFPVRLFITRDVSRRERVSADALAALGLTDPLPDGMRYRHGTLGGYVTAKCRCDDCRQWAKIWNMAVSEASLPFRFTPYQVRHTHASWLIDKGVDIEKVRHRLGHGDLTTTTRQRSSTKKTQPRPTSRPTSSEVSLEDGASLNIGIVRNEPGFCRFVKGRQLAAIRRFAPPMISSCRVRWGLW